MSNKLTLPFVEIMITQVCNLSCSGCTNYSDLSHNGYLSWADGKAEIEPWLERLDIPDFGIMGGEPLMNPEVRQWLIGIRELMPNSQIRFTTNGLLLSKNLDIIELCHDIGNVVFKITKHLESRKIDSMIDYVKSKYDWETVTEFGITRYKTSNNLRFQLNEPKTFLKTFSGDYENMMPHNSDPLAAFDVCCQKTCPLLYQGKLYKCSTTGLLQDTMQRFKNPNRDAWAPYITDGLEYDCDERDLKQFVDNFGKPNKTCGQCPTRADTQAHLVHFNNVSKKKHV